MGNPGGADVGPRKYALCGARTERRPWGAGQLRDGWKNGSTGSANSVANWVAAGVDCFSGGSEPTERTASPAPAATIAIAARYSILMAMVPPPSAPRTNRTPSEMVPERI